MTEFVTRCGPVGDGTRYHKIIFTTDDQKHYEYVQKAARFCVDHMKPQTNADRIRAMTDEELAVKISAFCDVSECRAENGAVCPLIHDCPLDQIGVSWLDWLKQPYGGADHE